MFRVGFTSIKYGLMGRRLSLYPKMSTAPWNPQASNSATSELEIRTVGYEDVKQRMTSALPDVHVIDVREPHEVAEHGYIPSAKNIPLSILKDVLHLDPEMFKQKVGHEKPAIHHELLFYCRSGRRSTVACEAALVHGYRNVVNYKGSWQDWSEKERLQTA